MTGPANVISLSAVRFSPESPEILRCAQNDKEEARNPRPDRQTFSLSTYRAPPHPPAGQSLRCAQNDKEEARNPRPDRQTFSLSTYRAPPHPPVGQSLRCAQNDVRRAGMMWRKLGMTQGGGTRNNAESAQNAKSETAMPRCTLGMPKQRIRTGRTKPC